MSSIGCPEVRDFIAAVAEADVLRAKNQLAQEIQNRVNSRRKKLADAIAKSLERSLPTSASGSQWWVDPIIGLRGQVNFARWLFLAVQGDVGRFDAGSLFAANVTATLGFNFTRNIFLETGYRFFYMDRSNDGFSYNAGEYGLFTGIGVKF